MSRRHVFALLLIGAVVVLPFSTFGSVSVCVTCGRTSSATDFQLPLIPVTYWRHRRFEETQLSTAAGNLGFLKPHSHEWSLIHGGGNGILCALGKGGELDATVRSAEVAQFLVDTARYCGRDEAYDWFQAALDHRKSKQLHWWMDGAAFPLGGFPTKDGYLDWRQRADLDWYKGE